MGHGVSPVLLGMNDHEKSTRDFAWHTRKTNPFYHAHGQAKTKLYIVCIAFSCAGMFALLLFHPLFSIRTIQVSGLGTINKAEFIHFTEGILNEKILFIFPVKSYLLVDTDEVADILRVRYPLSHITVKKVFPNTISLVLEEKISTIIYDNGISYSKLGLDGNILETVRKVGEDEWRQEEGDTSTSTAHATSSIHVPSFGAIIRDIGTYPILYKVNGADGKVNDHVVPPAYVREVIAWYHDMGLTMNIPIAFITQKNDAGDAEIHTKEGWAVWCRLDRSHEKELTALQTILKGISDRRALQYIDVRFPDKGFWR